MIAAFYILLIAAAALVALPSLVLLIECLAGAIARPENPLPGATRPARIGVLISAHNEEALIVQTLRSIMPQLERCDPLLVVADNCDDRTAELARAAGAIVTERHDPLKRGKGYGLSHGLGLMRLSPPDVLIIFDADCQVAPGVVHTLAAQAWAMNRPIQATYLLESSKSAGGRGAVSTLAFIVKNLVRPAGLAALGFPCALTGTGMAFPWPLIEDAPLASGHIVEDMELGLHLLRAGKGARLCTEATIRGHLPTDAAAAYVQRTRWEHGHLSLIFACALPLIAQGLRRARLELIAAGLDLIVPPLALLSGVWLAGMTLAGGFGIHWNLWTPAILFAAGGVMIAVAILSAWRRHARHLPLGALLAVPAYVLWKIPLYFRFLVRREKNWVRTARADLPQATDGATIA